MIVNLGLDEGDIGANAKTEASIYDLQLWENHRAQLISVYSRCYYKFKLNLTLSRRAGSSEELQGTSFHTMAFVY